MRPGAAALCVLAAPVTLGAATPDFAGDARALDALVAANYAYLDRFPGGKPPMTPQVAAARDAVHDRDSLLHYAEDVLTALADHHAITGASFKDDWAVVPTYADLWIERAGDGYVVDAVRPDTPAARAGVMAGDRLVAVGGVPIARALAAFWAPLGLDSRGERGAYGARVLAAGRRDRPRVLTVAGARGTRTLTLASLYATHTDRPPLTVTGTTIRFNNSLGDQTTIAAFDAAMAAIPGGAPVTIDLTDTPSGGNTSVARAVMGWFVRGPSAYQVHTLPAEERETGVPRQWIEQVLPRAGKYHSGPVRVRVGRWTGSMGEGIAIGFAAFGTPVCGTRMAGLRGAVYDFPLPASGLVVKLPAERLYTVSGTPREDFQPSPDARCR
ncbi:S41 family peptidase [Sphingomonas sp. NFR15]|uniref:S41 family peptidase n=1 Tax=Sphingomonas sp. NFR15 TaxID=1566282 RepID=UPI0008867A96|nr:PDZ domain-containing protein [Sphingomonas sp. NFR15]SDA20302.1 carboxyl-terminal processing protease [Sphingomonas sp. NFR15]